MAAVRRWLMGIIPMRLNRKKKVPSVFTNPYERAEQFLLDHLTPEQRKDYIENSGFNVKAKKYTWRITTQSVSGNVYLLDKNGNPEAGYCAAPRPLTRKDGTRSYIPYPDIWLAQKLFIESDEDAWLRVAIRSWVAYRQDREVIYQYGYGTVGNVTWIR